MVLNGDILLNTRFAGFLFVEYVALDLRRRSCATDSIFNKAIIYLYLKDMEI